MRIAVPTFLATVVATALAQPLSAQTKTPTPPSAAAPKTGTSAIMGVVLDSLNGRFLSRADVIVDGAKKALVTDSVGRFRLDSIPAGTYQVGVFHPMLDTLGISLATQPFHVGPDSVSFIVLSVPSAATIIRRACPVRPARSQGTSAVIGHVTDPETLQPVSGADVSIAWMQLEVSKEIGVRRTPRVLRDSTDAQGSFRICGVPSSVKATLQAKKRGAVTAEIPIELGDAESELFARTLLLSAVDSGVKTGNATVSGRVVLEGAPSNGGSRVEVMGTDVVVLTNENGDFTIRNLPSGSQVLLARHLGFGAETVPVDLSSHTQQKVTIKLPKFVAVMDPVTVTARRQGSLDKTGFNQRMKSGMGYYLGPQQIQQLHPNRVTDILRTVPSLRVSYSAQGETVESSRGVSSFTGGGCIQYFVDDSPWQSTSPGDVNQFINGNEVVAVEVYNGPGTPGQYTRAGQGDCTTIVLWTKFKIRDQ